MTVAVLSGQARRSGADGDQPDGAPDDPAPLVGEEPLHGMRNPGTQFTLQEVQTEVQAKLEQQANTGLADLVARAAARRAR